MRCLALFLLFPRSLPRPLPRSLPRPRPRFLPRPLPHRPFLLPLLFAHSALAFIVRLARPWRLLLSSSRSRSPLALLLLARFHAAVPAPLAVLSANHPTCLCRGTTHQDVFRSLAPPFSLCLSLSFSLLPFSFPCSLLPSPHLSSTRPPRVLQRARTCAADSPSSHPPPPCLTEKKEARRPTTFLVRLARARLRTALSSLPFPRCPALRAPSPLPPRFRPSLRHGRAQGALQVLPAGL